MVYKHAISTIVPAKPVRMPMAAPGGQESGQDDGQSGDDEQPAADDAQPPQGNF